MKYLRLLLFPFSLIYWLIVITRNWCYDAGLFSSTKFKLPVISVGNLEVGGAGKSPMTEYLIRLLKKDHQLATLSRGYGRDTSGFIIAGKNATASEVGDEPAQFKQKFADITVAVAEKRVEGITRLQTDHDLIILDDAYQHRAVKAGLSILLFDYQKLGDLRMVLPAGNYREPFSSRWRADIMIISKCPEQLSAAEQAAITASMDLLPYQQLFFTAIGYYPLRALTAGNTTGDLTEDTTVFLLTGIANADPLVGYIKKHTSHVIHHNYPDHHRFSLKNITKLADEFAACPSSKKVIITTEKDAQRLADPGLQSLLSTLPITVLPIGVKFLNGGQQFDQIVVAYVRKYREHHQVH